MFHSRKGLVRVNSLIDATSAFFLYFEVVGVMLIKHVPHYAAIYEQLTMILKFYFKIINLDF